MFKFIKSGFTLLEILLAVAALLILSSIVILALNPGKQLAQSNNAKSLMDINAIDKALKQYYIDHQNWPPSLSAADLNIILDICNTGAAYTDDCVNLDDLSPLYLAELPKNPRGFNYQIIKKTDDIFGFYAQGSDDYTLEPVLLNLSNTELSQALQDDVGVFYNLVYEPGANGSLIGSSTQSVLLGDNGLAIEAVPNIGFSFINWSDGLTDNPRVDLNVTEDVSVTANFSFVCGESVVLDDRDGNVYNTLLIAGDLCLLAENLKYLPEVHNNTEFQTRGTNSLPAYGVYAYNGNDLLTAQSQSNYNNYGVLYNWHAVSLVNICPTGWRVPSDYEWSYIEGFLDSNFESGNSEWDKTSWRGSDIGSNLKNNFNVSMSGARNNSGSFYSLNSAAFFWSSSNFFATSAWRRYLSNASNQSNRSVVSRNYGHSVRCLRGNIVPF